MWFKNLQIFRLPAPWNQTPEALEAQLARLPFQRCGSQDMQTFGFASPKRGDERLVYPLGGHWLIAFTVEQKLLPGGVIKETVDERAAEIELQQGYSPGRKQLKELKERVIEELLPRAFTRRRTTLAWIDTLGGWLVVDASSSAKADDLIKALHKAVDGFPLRLLETQTSPQSAMTGWLADFEAPAGFTIDRDCELKAVAEEKSAVRYARHALDGEEVKAHLVAGKLPTRLAMTWSDRISFVLTDKREVKRLAFLDLIKEEADHSAENADEQFDADFALMTGELSRLLPDLVDALGGEMTPPA